mgnify:CR=1 FL=1
MENEAVESKLTTIKQEEEDEKKDSTAAEKTIDEKCPVCLQQFDANRKAYAPVCFHSFCFECILEWTKIKHNCPLCKRLLDRIMFDVKSKYEFKEFYLKTSEELYNQHLNSLSQPVYIIGVREGGANEPPESDETSNAVNVYSKASFEAFKEAATIEFRSLIYINNWFATISQTQSYVNTIKLGDARVDVDDIYAKKNSIVIGYKRVDKLRAIDAKFYKRNQVSLLRLTPFIHRELKALSLIAPSRYRLDQNKRYILATKIINLLKSVDMDSEEFFNEIGPYVRPVRVARHFIHELKAFAGSTCAELIEYDARTVYYEEEDHKRFVSQWVDSDSKCPIVSVPVNMNKYRLSYSRQPTSTSTAATNIQVVDDETQLSESFQTNDTEQSSQLVDDSEHSSFCEEIEQEPKKTPEYICVSSSSCTSLSSSSSSSPPSSSTSPTSSDLNDVKPCTSKSLDDSTISKNKKKNKKEKKSHEESNGIKRKKKKNKSKKTKRTHKTADGD